jgi:hypothetical protein
MSRVIFLGAQLGVAGGDLVFLDMDRGEDVVACDPLGDQDRVLVVVAVPGHEGDDTFLPSASSPRSVDGPSAITSPLATLSPTFTSGFWLMQVFWFERWNLRSR